MSKALLTIHELAEMFSVTPTTIGRWVEAGQFPQPFRVNKRLHRWPSRVIEDFINGQRAQQATIEHSGKATD